MIGINFLYLISLITQKRLSLQLMDVMIAYLYGSLDSDIYMKVSDGISVPNANIGCKSSSISHCMASNSLEGCGITD
jgi:hypothetical protein